MRILRSSLVKKTKKMRKKRRMRRKMMEKRLMESQPRVSDD